MYPLLKIVPIFSLAIATSLPFSLVQAETSNQICQTLLNGEHTYNVNWYPVKPLPETVATDAVALQLDKLQAIAVSPSSLDLAIQQELVEWLFEKPDPGPPDTGAPARMDGLLKALPNSQKPQLTAIFDQLANRIEKLPSLNLRTEMTGKLAGYYQQLQDNDRAALFLNQAIAKALKSTDVQARAVQLTKLLDAVVELGLSKAIAPQLPQIETVLSRSVPSLSLARVYANTNQSQKALLLADRLAKATPAGQIVNSDLIALYLQLNQLSRANLYFKRSSPDDDAPYGRLVAAYDRAKQTQQADKLFKDGFSVPHRGMTNDHFLFAYLKAGGNPDRLFRGLPTLEGVGLFDLRSSYSLRAAGEYRRRNQPEKASKVIAQFVQLAPSRNLRLDDVLMAAITDGNLLEAKTAFEQLLAQNAFAKVEPPISFAAEINALDAIAPFVQRLSKDPERRIELLQSLAIAYAKQNQPDKAISIAERIPRQSSGYSSAIDTLAQVATVFAKSGQKTQAQMIFAKALSLSSNIKEIDTRAQAYAAIARAYTNVGETAAAETTRQTAVKWALSSPNEPNVISMPSLISQQFLLANQVEAAWKTLQDISQDAYKDTNISSLVVTALQLGNLPIAQQAVDLQYSYGAPELFLDQASQLAEAYLDRDRPEEAIKMLERAANVLNKQKEPNASLILPIGRLVRVYAKAGRIDVARELMKKFLNPISSNYVSWRQELQQYVDCHQKAFLEKQVA
ncbi:tetratricopeptide repeat protein [Nostoc sp.]|uniref:tetratricopeptide repeat protein n=1 Tax=Nostoc sp. TaxID=1180 RepID=UPI002FF7E1EC